MHVCVEHKIYQPPSLVKNVQLVGVRLAHPKPEWVCVCSCVSMTILTATSLTDTNVFIKDKHIYTHMLCMYTQTRYFLLPVQVSEGTLFSVYT